MKELSNFQYVWEEWLVPLIYDLYKQLDPKFQKECNVQIRDLKVLRDKAEKYYQKKREELKRAFYGEYHRGESATNHRMDFHKIGSIICRTMIEFKVYSFDIDACHKYVDENTNKYDTDWVVRNALINYRLAFYASVVFLYQSMIFCYSEENDKLCQKLREKEHLNLYSYKKSNKTDEVQESFENCIVLDLAKRDVDNHSFDYFMYAIILYQLEQHNKSLLLADMQ